ncbi:MAG TPA: YgiT-type zinc finger protein [Ktedonobacterales bacterium]|nr:YgiT-type zinc finger protein [Ktedonobacterales bacterium]
MERDDEQEAFERKWTGLSEEVLSGMAAWRAQHPQATLTEIEVELDARLARLRVRLLERVAQQSQAAAWSGQSVEPAAAPLCPHCGAALEPRGRKTRRLKTHGGQEVILHREYGVCSQCGQGLFPPG